MQFGGIDPVGSSRIGSLPNPRRNTSKEFFESFWSGKKAEIFFLFISTLFPLLVVLDGVEERKRKDISASKPSISNERQELR
ncbi:MAG: hypothetical protein DMG08_14560 [Acidobacteria bacterium]|nr:MAG: hypothetical protein DMG08_14560 [Acidobacteriota bacterium]